MVGGALIAMALTACSSGFADALREETAQSTSLALDESRGWLWLASQDDRRLILLDAWTLETLRAMDLPGVPAHIALVHETVHVTMEDVGELWSIDAISGTLRHQARLPCRGAESVLSLGREADSALALTCPQDLLLLVVDPREGTVTQRIALPSRPGLLARRGNALAVAAHQGGDVRVHALLDDAPQARLSEAPDRLSLAGRPGRSVTNAAILLASPATEAWTLLYDAIDNDGDRSRPPERGGYGDVVDGDPRIEARASGACAGAWSRFDGGARVFSGVGAATFSPQGDLLWIAHVGTRNLGVFHCDRGGEGALLPLAVQVPLGGGARGIVVSSDGRHAWLDLSFDQAVTRVTLDERFTASSVTRRLAVPSHRYTPRAQLGRRLFFDATNTHLTPSGVVSCATCHPGGGDDGVSWFLHTPQVSRRFVRTPPAWALREELGPFHRNGEFEQAERLITHTIRQLMGGDALVIDADAIAQWLRELAPPPARPPYDHEDAQQMIAGEAVFQRAGCGGCHAGPWMTDGRRHDVVLPSRDPDARIEGGVVTPTLRGVGARGPWLHDGRALTLESLFAEHNPGDLHGVTSGLNAEELESLVHWLGSR